MRARVLAQKSEEATASYASLLATPLTSLLHYVFMYVCMYVCMYLPFTILGSTHQPASYTFTNPQCNLILPSLSCFTSIAMIRKSAHTCPGMGAMLR